MGHDGVRGSMEQSTDLSLILNHSFKAHLSFTGKYTFKNNKVHINIEDFVSKLEGYFSAHHMI